MTREGRKGVVVVGAVLVLLMVSMGVYAQIGAGTAADPAYYYGDTYFMGNGAFRTYISVDHDNELPVTLGVEFNSQFFIDPPPGSKEIHEYTVVLPLPTIAGVYTPFTNFESNWSPLGHPGTPYERPHMDFHFFMSTPEFRAKIKGGICGGGEANAKSFCKGVKPFRPECVPPAYIQPGLVVPGQGSHLLDATGPELNGGKFLDTFIFGAYDGRIVFYEPMVTTEAFEAILNGTWGERCLEIRNPQFVNVAGYYPSLFCYRYLMTGNIRVEMSNFVHIPAGCEGELEFGGPGSYFPATDPNVSKKQKDECDECEWFSYRKNLPQMPKA